jgi:hypothetical protein
MPMVMNLVTNAFEAIGEWEGVIRVAAEQVKFGSHLSDLESLLRGS